MASSSLECGLYDIGRSMRFIETVWRETIVVDVTGLINVTHIELIIDFKIT
jgi:hypothetical protein